MIVVFIFLPSKMPSEAGSGWNKQELRTGDCADFTCVSCLSEGEAASADRSTCLACGASTSGLGTNDCFCPSSGGYLQVL